MAKTDKQLHIAMFPWLAMGHIYPNFELAKIFAQKGHSITLISTPRNIGRLPQVPSHLEHLIKLVSLPILPKHRENLPDNAESSMDVTPNQIPYLKMAYDGLQESLSQLLKSSPPDWILYDFASEWLPPLARSLQIQCVFFGVSPAWNICFFDTPKAQLGNAAAFRTKPEDYLRPPHWIPFHSNIGLKPYEVKKMFEGISDKETGNTVSFNFNKAVSDCDFFSFRSCNELESEWLNLLAEIYKKPVSPVGVIPPSCQVVYIAFGSELKLGQQDLTEMALGLELSGLPFFWALKKQRDSSVDLPDGFQDRISDRGVVCKDWVPQLKILAHESIGVYFTHCGSGSAIEGLHFGRVLVMLPYLLDQALFARVLEEKKLGIEIPRNEEDGSFTRNSVAKSLRLALIDVEGSIYREKAKDMGFLFSDKDRHEEYINKFLERLQNNKASSKN
ncbi:UDP-glycosyltransferase [Quillaja saponaria]|uniref:UDP-glycosyltransferase n=1 Tax=Quillaja saponaria TaxID=32244 RepID=A0AAD7LPD5_QUISA|nr:UDP-glycosyltransferase [Quillaja saponaria]